MSRALSRPSVVTYRSPFSLRLISAFVIALCVVALAPGQKAPTQLEGFKLLPGGAFRQGDVTTDRERRQVRVESFEILDHPVTNREYKRFIDATDFPAPLHWTRGRIPAGKEAHPVIYVNREDVEAYLNWLSAQDGRVYRLPTVSEFEYAARGGEEGRKYYWGDAEPTGKANYDSDGKREFARWQLYLEPARSRQANAFGLYGMSGNVWQMATTNPDPAVSLYKYRIENLPMVETAVAGGSWARTAEYLRCGFGASISSGSRQPDLGFRPVRSPQGIDWRIEPRKLTALSMGHGSTMLSWALLSSDLPETTFDVYRAESRSHAGFKINRTAIVSGTTHLDSGLEIGRRYHYYVRPVVPGGREGRRSEWAGVTASQQPQMTVVTFQPLYRQGGLDPVFGDLDGDGRMDCVIRLDNGNVEMAPDPGLPVQLEAFTSYGRSLWRRNLSDHDHCFGNAHNVPFNVWDMDGDGRAEVITRLQIGDTSCLAILDGMTGAVKRHVKWPDMLTDVQRSSSRVHLAVACLDGKNPAVIIQTGLYENEVITAFDGSLDELWQFQSIAETNGSGGHTIEVADVDGDGKQEIFCGTTCLTPDGILRWSIYRQHPDVVSIRDFLPDRPGLEVFFLVESSIHAGAYLADAKTGKIIWKSNREDDPRWSHGHAGWTADIWSGSPGIECAGNRAGHNDKRWVLYSAAGRILAEPFPADYIPLEWDGDESRELLSPDGRVIANFNGTALVPVDCLPPNPFPDARVLAVADIYGDFRDELILLINVDKVRKAVAVVMATDPLPARFLSRTQDRDYRQWLARNIGGGYRSVFDLPLAKSGQPANRQARQGNAAPPAGSR
jgi:rhamnogalacturonan endolyase